jgi:hypothetical protein
MAIDASIALGLKPVQVENPLNNMVKFANIQNDMANMELHRQKMEAGGIEAQRLNELSKYLGSGGRDENRILSLGGEKALNELRQSKLAELQGAEVASKTADAGIARHKDILANYVNTPEQARQWLYAGFTDPATKVTYNTLGSFDQLAARIPNDPAEFGKWKEQNVVGMEKHLQNTAVKNTTNLGNRYEQRDAQGRLVGQPMMIGATIKERSEIPPDILTGLANQDALEQQIKQGNPAGQAPVASQATQLLNASVAQANDQTPPPISPLAANVASQQQQLDAVNAKLREDQKQAAADKKAFEFKTLVADVAQLEANGQGNSPTAQRLKARIAKKVHIAEGVEPLTEAGRELAGGLVGMGFMPSSRATVALNAAALAGVTPKQFVTNKANLSALTKITQTEAQSGAFASAFDQNAKAVLDMAGKVGKSGIPIIDEYFANPLSRATGKNPELAAYGVFIKATANEWGKLVSSASGGNQALAQAEIKRIEKLLNDAQSQEQVRAALSSMDLESLNRKYGFEAQKAKLLGETPPEPPVNPRATPKLITKVIDGKTYIKSEDGKWRAK